MAVTSHAAKRYGLRRAPSPDGTKNRFLTVVICSWFPHQAGRRARLRATALTILFPRGRPTGSRVAQPDRLGGFDAFPYFEQAARPLLTTHSANESRERFPCPTGAFFTHPITCPTQMTALFPECSRRFTGWTPPARDPNCFLNIHRSISVNAAGQLLVPGHERLRGLRRSTTRRPLRAMAWLPPARTTSLYFSANSPISKWRVDCNSQARHLTARAFI